MYKCDSSRLGDGGPTSESVREARAQIRPGGRANLFFHPRHNRTKSFLRHILPKEGDNVERVAGGAPLGMGAEATYTPRVEDEPVGDAADTAIPDIPLAGGPAGEVPLPPGDEVL